MHSTSMHGLKKRSVTSGGREPLPIAPAYWPKPRRCYSTTAPSSSPSPADYRKRERHESASAWFNTNRHPRNGAESRPYSCTRARTGAGTDQSAGKGTGKSNRTRVIGCIFLGSSPRASPRKVAKFVTLKNATRSLGPLAIEHSQRGYVAIWSDPKRTCGEPPCSLDHLIGADDEAP